MSEKLSNLPVAEIVDPDGDYIYIVQYINDATPHWESRKIVPEDLNWELVLDEDGTSIANWTSIAGTWSADAGGYIKQTDTTAAYRMLRYTSRVFPGTAFVMQAEVRFPTAATTSRRALLGPLSAGGVSSTHDPWIGIGENSDLIIMQRGDQSLASEALTVNEDQWYTIRVEVLGNYVTLSVDGTRVYSIGVRGNASTEVLAHYASLVNYTGEVHYRNIKAWRLAGPA